MSKQGAEFVADLPLRVAHVTHAVLAASSEPGGPGPGPLKASEIVVYDWEAIDVRMTGTALAAARRCGLVDGIRGLWFATPKAHEFGDALEDRSLRDEDEARP